MSKPFKNHEEQMDLIESRGLHIDCRIKTKDYLFLNNYYNVVNRYGHYFKRLGTEQYFPGSSFKELIKVNIFDRELKGIFYSKILEIENNLKSVISYVFSEEFPLQNSYLVFANFDSSRNQDFNNYSDIINKIIDKHKFRSGNAISHYFSKHGHVPLWVLVNFMSFGNISYLYKIMRDSEKTKVAKFFSNNLNLEFGRNDIRIDPGDFTSYIDAINDLRNAAAHDECMLTFTYRTSVPYNVTMHNLFSIPRSSPRQNLYNMMVVMRVFLNENQFKRLYNTTINRAKELSNGLSSISADDVFLTLGFPSNWGYSPKYHMIDHSLIP